MKLIWIYLLIVNAAGFLLMLTDKGKAKKNLRRIPEKVLMGVALAGGSLGTLAGMKCAHHKTLHPHFSIGVPVMLATHILCYIIFFA